MEISLGIEIVGLALWIPRAKTLVINDLHIGYEEALHRKGILVPKFQLQQILNEMAIIFSHVHPKTVVINGDLKHEFGTVLRQEWNDVLRFLDFVLKHCREIIIIQGNHDQIINAIANKRNIKVIQQFSLSESIQPEVLIVHGDKIVETNAKRIIIGHEHPAITLRDKSKAEKFKCFLRGKWKKKELIAVPSFNPLLEGTDILKEQVLSPYLASIGNFDVFIIDKGEVFPFGKVKKILR